MAVPEIPGVITRNAQAGYTSYEDTLWYEPGRPLTADGFEPMIIVQRAFRSVLAGHRGTAPRPRDLPGLRMQARLPAPLDLALR